MTTSWLRPGEYREIIQIGAVKVDSTFAPIGRFDVLVRPRLNPVLSQFLEELTGITNAELVARGIDLGDACRQFTAFTGWLPVFAYGRDDLVLADNFRLYGMKERPPSRFLNVRDWLVQQGVEVSGLHACDVGPACGAPFEGHKHNALDDALSVAAGVRHLIAKGTKPPVLS